MRRGEERGEMRRGEERGEMVTCISVVPPSIHIPLPTAPSVTHTSFEPNFSPRAAATSCAAIDSDAGPSTSIAADRVGLSTSQAPIT
jgi:hypothetical protein